MIYAQEKKGQKLHLAFELENGLTNPVCGRKVQNYRITVNLPMGRSCKNCRKRINSPNFDAKGFVRKYYD